MTGTSHHFGAGPSATRTSEDDDAGPAPDAVAAALAEFSDAIRTHYGSRLVDVVLFGSRARGDAGPRSDADVAVVLEDGPWNFWHEKRVLADMSWEPLMDHGLKIQPWPVARSAWVDASLHPNPQLVGAMHRDGRRIIDMSDRDVS